VKAARPKNPISLYSGIIIVGALALALWNSDLYAQRDQKKAIGKAAGRVTAAAKSTTIQAGEDPGIVSALRLIDLNAGSFLPSAWPDTASRGACSISQAPAANWSDGQGVMVFKGPVTVGAFLNNQDSVADQSEVKSVFTAFQTFINCELRGGWYLNMVTTSPQEMCGAKHLIVPIGPSIGIVQSFNGMPVDLQLGAHYEAHDPSSDPGWQLRFMAHFPFPR